MHRCKTACKTAYIAGMTLAVAAALGQGTALAAGDAKKADAMGMGEETGTLEAGKLADLLVVDGDPVADVRILQDRSKLLGVMKCGTLVTDSLAVLETSVDEPANQPQLA